MARHWFFGLLAAVLFSAEALASCQLTGLVESKLLPLENAVVVISRTGIEITRSTTRADGKFDLRYDEFPDRLQSVMISVKAGGHTDDERLLFRERNGRCLEVSEHHVILEPQQAAGSVNSSSLGLTIYIAPYTLYGEGADAIAQRFNHDMPQIVHHRILAYKSLLRVPTTQVDISVDTIDEPLTAAQGERIRRRGRELNALGMIAGDGDLLTDNGGDRQIHLTSVFRTIPVYRQQGMIMQPIRDSLPARRASPSRPARQFLHRDAHNRWCVRRSVSSHPAAGRSFHRL